MHNKVAVVFDFDDTLAPDSTTSFLQSVGVDVDCLWKKEVPELVKNGWDNVPAYLYMMIKKSQASSKNRITKSLLADWGKKIKPYSGVSTMFSRLKKIANKINPEVELEFYLVSSGIGEILRNTPIAKNFTEIWSCDFHYNSKNEIEYPKNIVSFTEKTRFIFNISKGLIGEEYRNSHGEVNRRIGKNEYRIPIKQMVYVGDGYTDVPCFSLMKKYGGVSFGVFNPSNPSKWETAWGFVQDSRVSSLLPAEYGKKSALFMNLSMAISNICKNVKT